MTENLYEINDLTNGSNSLTLTRSGYGIHSTSLQPSPVSPHVNQKYMPSPTTPQNELSPLLEISQDEGSWEHNQLEKSASSMLNETMNSYFVYPFNVAEALHGLDSFSKAFPGKNPNTVFGNSVGEKNSEDNQVSEILLSPQRGTPSAASDSEPFSPVTMQSNSQQCHNQLMHHPIDSQNMAHNPYQSHQQYYGYQHHKPQLRENNPVPLYKVPFYKSQSQYVLQPHGNQIHQQQLTSYSLAQQKQQIPLDVQEGHESIGSPTDSYTEDYKTSEQTVFQAGLQTSHFQGSQNFLSLSHQSNLYQQQQTNELSHSFPFKQNPSFEDHLGSVDMPGYSNLKEEVYMDLNYHHKQEDFYSSHYQSVGSGANQTAPSPALRGGVFHHLNSYRPPCGQTRSSDGQEDQLLSYYRTEALRPEGAKTKLKCILCLREFKSLPALNGHMRSHGGFRTHPTTLKTDYSVPSRLPNNFHNYLRHTDLDDSDESRPQRQKVLTSRVKSSVGVGECAAKQEKKRYRHCLVPLVISPCDAGLESRGPVLFQSQLRSPGSCGDDVPYTPPPMLSPIRPGSGLFSSVNAGHPCTEAQNVPRVHLCKDSEKYDCNATLDPGDKSSSIKPRINIGCDFQADIPDIQSRSKLTKDIHKANLLWTPCYLDTPEKQQRVDDLLKMACSSVLPGGGMNTEYTLHCLFECSGDIMTTLEKLLSLTALNHVSSRHTNYHYAGSDKWTLQEKRQLNKALLIHNKDFYLIQKMVKTKSVPQCVEYYYTWKEKLRLGRRFSTGPITPGQVKTNKGHLKEGNTRQPAHETKNKTVALEFSELSDNVSGALVCEVPRSGPMFNGNEWNQSNISGLCNSPAEHNRPKSAQHFAPGSVKSSPSNSSTSGDTDSNLIFPCTECGKVFLKVKSRNAHMKTHRQPDDPQFWQLHSLPEQENKTMTPASPTVGLLQLPLTPHSLAAIMET
ncbi:transcriptional-regulating factor 1 isoform X1 [Ictalurus furcatus]|uniref:transcriptional-regulating factor 1 isoform X1 n=1 Tax=Ictalurus furcatus TaxID=66913 RepID=UPI0023507472|nr:transcriptional-regulating factor 1 isoform X1 [Ictalurus furcatus]XP_053488126.1 transcriptional-regulating factor 1 isoform X1 [Ictalurus furcatus]